MNQRFHGTASRGGDCMKKKQSLLAGKLEVIPTTWTDEAAEGEESEKRKEEERTLEKRKSHKKEESRAQNKK